MKSLNLQEVLALPEVEELLDPYAFENYCGACFNFDTENCPFYNRIDNFTNWKNIKCDKFYD